VYVLKAPTNVRDHHVARTELRSGMAWLECPSRHECPNGRRRRRDASSAARMGGSLAAYRWRSKGIKRCGLLTRPAARAGSKPP